ncbi:hypothetical protein GSF70_10430 [Flavobacteriaceae bacterium W22]|nr:hypothetical protein [Flavobacteriaceae bacterium W22]
MDRILNLNKEISYLLDTCQYREANDALEKALTNRDVNDYLILKAIAGFFIDLGNESYDRKKVEKGLQILLDNKDKIKNYVTEDSINYCIGNAYQSFYKIDTDDVSNFFPIPENIETLFEAKQYYFRSFKALDIRKPNHYSIQVFTNLGNNLINSGRYVEAFQLYDNVLNYNHNFFYALAAKAEGLLTMVKYSQCPITIALFIEVYRLFNEAEKHKIPFEAIREKIKTSKSYAYQFLQEQNFCISKIPHEAILNNEEYQKHPLKLKFFLDNFLSLSEHSLYCSCNGAEKDDITIGHGGFQTNNKKIVQLELLCNRIKSEFCFSKELFFDYFHDLKTVAETTHYENLVDGIVNGIKYEKLRTSFRLCFGILDKIAEGICYIFDFTMHRNESIYFENFWSEKRNSTRWQEINKKRNIHLTALYSIACDLEKNNGEFGFYKEWRNKLEHGIFSIKDSKYFNSGWEEEKFSLKTDLDHFEKETLRLLQLTRSAIFSFVFCARIELIES